MRLDWPWNNRHDSYNQGLGAFDERPWVVSARDERGEGRAESQTREASFDLNGDGFSDLVIAARHQTWALAVSGVDGEPLWVAARGSAADAQGTRTVRNRGGGEAVAYQPAIVPDQDGDGVSELLVTFVRKADRGAAVERWLELVSGSSGEAIWRYDLPAVVFQLPAGEDVPYALMWFYGPGHGMSSGGSSYNYYGRFAYRDLPGQNRDGPHTYLPTEPRVLSLSAPANKSSTPYRGAMTGDRIIFLAGAHLVHLDLNSGKPLGPLHEIGVRTGIQPRYGDFDGDASIDVLLVEQLPDRLIPSWSGNIGVPRKRLVVWSPAKQALLWEREIESDWPRQPDVTVRLPAWPLAVDVDGDGATDVLAPDGSMPDGSRGVPPWGKLVLLNGRNGEPRWHRQIFNMDRELRQFVAGPDINDDGVAEVYVASLWGNDFRLFVDCLSGNDGHTLWRMEHPLLSADKGSGQFIVANLSWYRGAGDGWPQLVVPIRLASGNVTDRVLLVSAATGRLTHLAGDVTEVEAGDLDADGTDDLVLFRRTIRNVWDQDGTLHAVRGVGREVWRKIDSTGNPVGDLDGDGIQDLVAPNTRGPLTAISGATGEPIWQTTIDTGRRRFFVHQATVGEMAPLAAGASSATDLDEDGTPDLLVAAGDDSHQEKLPVLITVSGRTGRQIWRTDFVVQQSQTPLLLESRDLDRDGELEIVLVAPTDFGFALRDHLNVVKPEEVRLWLVVLSGRDGKTLWRQPLTELQRSGSWESDYDFDARLHAAYADLDGDGVDDVMLPAQRAPNDQALDLQAFSGSDGRSLWQLPLPNIVNKRYSFIEVPSATAGDVDKDGRSEVIMPSLAKSTDEQGRPTDVLRIQTLDGSTGHVRWQWETPVDHYDIWGGYQEKNFEMRPLLVRRPDGKRWIAITFASPESELQVRVLNEDGELVSERTTKQIFSGLGTSPLWVLDSDGDGGDELVLMGQMDRSHQSPIKDVYDPRYWNENFGELSLLRPDKLDEPLWTRTEPLAILHQVLTILPDESAAGRIVVLGGRGGYARSSMRGLDPATGETRWTCVGPGAAQLLNPPTTDVPPHAFFQYGGQSLVRRGILTWPQASSLPIKADAWRTFARPQATLTPNDDDPRLLRPLPWMLTDRDLHSAGQMTAWAAFYGLTLAAVPVLFVGWLIRRRRWGMNVMLMLPVVVGIVMLGLLISFDDSDIRPLLSKLDVAYVGTGPVMFTLVLLATWLRQGRRRRVAVWLLLALLAVVAASVIQVLNDPALQPDERYSLEGWYIVLLLPLLLICWMFVLVTSVAWIVRLVWRWSKSRRSRKDLDGTSA